MTRKGNRGEIVSNPHENADGRFREIGGSRFDDFNNSVMNEIVNAQWFGNNASPEKQKQVATAALAAQVGIGPKDEIEGMLGAQMITTHAAAMECFRRAMIEGQTFQGRHQALEFANKLSRTYTTLMEALDRHRGKGGQQKVTVEHVHVHQGGQAIVGNVTPGGGAGAQIEGQPHGQALPVSELAALPCPSQENETTMPEPSREGLARVSPPRRGRRRATRK